MLKKREIFRLCFDNFDYDRIAAYSESDVERILNTKAVTIVTAVVYCIFLSRLKGNNDE